MLQYLRWAYLYELRLLLRREQRLLFLVDLYDGLELVGRDSDGRPLCMLLGDPLFSDCRQLHALALCAVCRVSCLPTHANEAAKREQPKNTYTYIVSYHTAVVPLFLTPSYLSFFFPSFPPLTKRNKHAYWVTEIVEGMDLHDTAAIAFTPLAMPS